MYQLVLILIVLAAIVWIFWLVKKGRIDKRSSKQAVADGYGSLRSHLQFKDKKLLATMRILSYQILLICIILLIISGFLPVMLTGTHLSGLALILHVTVAPFFCVSLAVFALLWAYRFRFEADDSHLLKNKSFARIFTETEISASWEKVIFWLFLIFAVPAVMSIILSMYPIFNPDSQEILLETHRYTTLALVIMAFVHAVYMINRLRTLARATGESS